MSLSSHQCVDLYKSHVVNNDFTGLTEVIIPHCVSKHSYAMHYPVLDVGSSTIFQNKLVYSPCNLNVAIAPGERAYGKLSLFYLYRDEYNYKVSNCVTFNGYIDARRLTIIVTALLHNSLGFLPQDLDLPILAEEEDYSDPSDNFEAGVYYSCYHEPLELRFDKIDCTQPCIDDEIKLFANTCLEALPKSIVN